MAKLDKKAAAPLYAQLADLLLPEIRKTPVGERFFPERQIARDYRTGLIVARAALQKLAREGYLKRVVSRGTFVVSHTLTRRPARQALKIALFWPMGNTMPHGEAAREIVNNLAQRGHAVEVRDSERRSDNAALHAAQMIRDAARECDGVIWIGAFTEFFAAVPAALAGCAKKTVFLNPYMNHPALTCVLRDNFSAVYALTAHLLEHGRRRIAFAGDASGRLFVTERFRGYSEALNARGIATEAQNVYMAGAGVSLQEGYALADKLLRERTKMPQALVCCTDYMAMGAIARLRENGVRVPEDVAVTGFDNIAPAEQFVPAITTADQAYQPMGALAVHLLLAQIDETLAPGAKVYVPCRLYIRRSCGC